MARTLSGDIAAKVAQQYASEPIIVVKIEWPSGTRYYTDKDYTFGATVCEPKILELGSFTSQKTVDTSGNVSSLTISLDDTDSTIKTSVNKDMMTGVKCTVYLSYIPGPYPDAFDTGGALVLLTGLVANDVEWSEGQRTVNFTIDTSFKIAELGYAPKAGDLANLSKEAEGKMWPIVFGSCVKVPAVQIYKTVRGKLATLLNASSTTINVEGGDQFPQGTSVTIRLFPGLLCQGTFDGNVFTVTQYNKPVNTAVGIAARGSDADAANPAVLWVSGGAWLYGQYCYATNGTDKLVNYCYRQEGNKCWFAKAWKVNGQTTTYALPGFVSSIAETSFFVRTAWGATFVGETIRDGIPVTVSSVVPDSQVSIPGFEVYLVDGTVPTYVVNNVPTTAIKGVFAYRTIDGVRTLSPVPSSRYTKTLSVALGGHNVTTISFPIQLSDYANESWEDELFVTMQSTLGSNTSDVIKYILETYTDYTADTTTFAAVSAKVANYPSHFALLDQKDVLQLIADIAYQARIAVRYTGDKAYLYYLSETPTNVETLTDDLIRMKTITYGFTSIDDIVTKYIAKWRPSYDAKDESYVYKNNSATFGVKEEEKDYFIYNIASLVKLSADFWGNRKSNCWRTAKLGTFMQAIELELFDSVTLKTATALSSGVRGEVTNLVFDSSEDSIGLDLTLASKSGVSSGTYIVEDMTYFTGGVTGAEPLPDDPTLNSAEVDYSIYSPGTSSDPTAKPITKPIIKFTSLPDRIIRGVPFSVSAAIYAEDGTTLILTGVALQLAIAEASGGTDVISPTTVTFVNGVATFSATVTVGTTDTNAVLNILGGDAYSTAISPGIPVTSNPTPTIVITPKVTGRGITFSYVVTGGRPSTTYTVSIVSDDVADVLKDSGGTAVTSFTTDGSGGFTGSWKITTGTLSFANVVVTANYGGQDYAADLLIIEAGTKGLGTNPAVVMKVLSVYSGNIYNVEVYTKYPTTTGASKWTTRATHINSSSSSVIPANTLCMGCGVLHDSPTVYDATDYDFFVNLAVWM